jgi:hypothetical protein
MATKLADIPRGPGANQTCPKCQSPDYSPDSWCTSCGYYARFGTYIEVDPDYEQYHNGRYVGPEETDPANPWGSFFASTPDWAWLLGTVPILVTIAGFALRFLTAAGSAHRIVLVVGMVVVGVVCLVTAHTVAGVRNARRTRDFSLMDILLCPIRLWIDTCRDLPNTLSHAAFGLAGLTAVVIAHVVVGVPYLTMFDTSAPPRERNYGNPAQIVADAARCGEIQAESLEEALDSLSDEETPGSTDEEEEVKSLTLEQALAEVFSNEDESIYEEVPPLEGDESEEEDPEAEVVALRVKAIVIGYDASDNRVQSLIIAISSASGWRVPATSVDVPADAAEGLLQRFATVHRAEPFVASDHSATWIEPIFHCSVEGQFDKEQDAFHSVTLLKMH